WNHGLPGNRGHLPLLDPEGTLWNRLRDKSIGCVVNGPCEVTAPGVIVHSTGNRWTFGEPDGSGSARLRSVIEVFNAAGVVADDADLRQEIWRKLANNASNSPVAALTHMSPTELGEIPELQRLARGITRETLEVGAALGWDVRAEATGEPAGGRGGNRPRF